ncbi:multiple sugar transport system substrate-binding protein [Caldalkalibacillus uzonensis]|uniref:Multiple sugar transport system substrate-binding protein n=1 Tax=Caldalkalibacillus uzonensis TaxID=353224 RepID=A0ABU0CVV9_9BACI|nr:sugar ABC transporter substrate-binding protein [Caldalkalibacillus uzonensis]MDQ0340558.1 multiple sugar transport system substrate-binding protein [Caldalkalibacillus uzonensis]
MKKTTIAFLSLLLILAVSACSSDTGSSDDSNQSNNTETVELTFSVWGNEHHVAMYEELLEEFYEDHPHIKVNIESYPHADYQQKMSVLAAGQELPDVGWVAERMVPQFVENGILRDVTEITEDPEFDFEDFYPSTLELWQHDGKLLGFPFSTPPMIMYFNKTIFDEAGVKTPNEHAEEGTWTWEQFEETAKAISSGEGANRIYGANLWIDWTNFATVLSHTWSAGGEIFNEDMTEFKWNSPEGIETFKMLQRMMFEDKSHVPPGENIPFETGRVGMFTFMYSYIANVRGIDDFEWDIAPLPSGPEGTAPLLGQAGLVAFEGSEHPEAAMELLKFLASKKGIQAQSQFFVPPRQSVLESDEFVNVPNNPPRESIERALLNEMDNGRIYPLHKDWTQIESIIVSGFDELFSQSATPEEILQKMENEINPILQK